MTFVTMYPAELYVYICISLSSLRCKLQENSNLPSLCRGDWFMFVEFKSLLRKLHMKSNFDPVSLPPISLPLILPPGVLQIKLNFGLEWLCFENLKRALLPATPFPISPVMTKSHQFFQLVFMNPRHGDLPSACCCFFNFWKCSM